MKSTSSKIQLFKSFLSSSSLAMAAGFAGSIFVAGTATPALACGPDSYIGTVCAVPFNWCPVGTLPADGRQLQINGNEVLYSLINTFYGGSQQSGLFSLPDLRGRGIVHYGAGVNLPVQAFASKSGAALTALSYANLPLHSHPATFIGVGGGEKTVAIPATPGTLGVTAKLSAKDEAGAAALNANSYLGKGPASGSGAANIYVPSTSTSAPVALSGLDVQLTGTAGTGPISFTYQQGITDGVVTIGNAGNGIPFSTQSPSLAMSYCIIVNGIYPERP